MRSANHASTVALCAATGSTVELQAATIVVIAIVITIFITRTSTSSQKKSIQLGHRQLHPGGAPMIALRRAFRHLHVTQQGIHLGPGKLPVGPYRAMPDRQSVV